MAFLLSGLIVPKVLGLGWADVIDLPQGLVLKRVLSGWFSAGEGLPSELATEAARLSVDQRIAYIEAEFFGGHGRQAAVGFQDGRLAVGPLLTQTHGEDAGAGYVDLVPGAPGWAINDVLRWIGAEADGCDEFDSLNLGSQDQLRGP